MTLRAPLLGLMLLLSTSALGACLQIDGGAVEVAWVVRLSDQTKGDCNDPSLSEPIDRLRLVIKNAHDPTVDLCETGEISGCEFDCELGSGVTPFNIPEGSYLLGLQPLSADGSPIPTDEVVVPPLVERDITTGDLADLGLWQVVILVADGTSTSGTEKGCSGSGASCAATTGGPLPGAGLVGLIPLLAVCFWLRRRRRA